MKVAVVGCGGVGGVVAVTLATNKHNLSCIEKGEEIVRVLNERGLQMSGKKGKFNVQVKAFDGFSEELGTFDIIFLAVKSNVLGIVFDEAKKYLCASGFIVTIQNGIEILSIAGENPNIKIVAGAVGYNVIAKDIGIYHVTAEGGVTFGTLNTASKDDRFLMKGLLEPIIPVKFDDNIQGILWSKLLIVCGVAGLGGVSGLTTGELLGYPVARKLFYRIVTEGSLLAKKLDIQIVKFGGALNPERFGNHSRGLPLPVRWLLLKIIGRKFRDLVGNITWDLKRGNKTEVDYINGAIVREGERVGFDTPVNSLVVKMIKEIEEGRREMGPDNLFEMWNAVKRGDKPG